MKNHTCTHELTIQGVVCLQCIHANTPDLLKTAQEFLRLIKHNRGKETESHIDKLEHLPKVGTRKAGIMKMRLLEGLTYKQIGERMGFTLERGRQLFNRSLYVIEEFIENQKRRKID